MSTSNTKVFDSIPNIDLPPHTKLHIVAIICIKGPNIVLDFVPVQEQHGHCDCSIFAIAFNLPRLCVLEINNPAESTYVQHLL